jgi:hypothetical protein
MRSSSFNTASTPSGLLSTINDEGLMGGTQLTFEERERESINLK